MYEFCRTAKYIKKKKEKIPPKMFLMPKDQAENLNGGQISWGAVFQGANFRGANFLEPFPLVLEQPTAKHVGILKTS